MSFSTIYNICCQIWAGHFAWNFQLLSLANCLTMETAWTQRLEAGAREKILWLWSALVKLMALMPFMTWRFGQGAEAVPLHLCVGVMDKDSIQTLASSFSMKRGCTPFLSLCWRRVRPGTNSSCHVYAREAQVPTLGSNKNTSNFQPPHGHAYPSISANTKPAWTDKTTTDLQSKLQNSFHVPWGLMARHGCLAATQIWGKGGNRWTAARVSRITSWGGRWGRSWSRLQWAGVFCIAVGPEAPQKEKKRQEKAEERCIKWTSGPNRYKSIRDNAQFDGGCWEEQFCETSIFSGKGTREPKLCRSVGKANEVHKVRCLHRIYHPCRCGIELDGHWHPCEWEGYTSVAGGLRNTLPSDLYSGNACNYSSPWPKSFSRSMVSPRYHHRGIGTVAAVSQRNRHISGWGCPPPSFAACKHTTVTVPVTSHVFFAVIVVPGWLVWRNMKIHCNHVTQGEWSASWGFSASSANFAS